jgi:hypothetical protein
VTHLGPPKRATIEVNTPPGGHLLNSHLHPSEPTLTCYRPQGPGCKQPEKYNPKQHSFPSLPFQLKLPFTHRPAVPFLASPAFRKVFTDPAPIPCPPRFRRSLCLAFRRLWSGAPDCLRPPELSASCQCTVAALHPLGDRDSPEPETSPSYLTRLGAVSYRPSPHSSRFRVTDGARTPPEELVNPACLTPAFQSGSTGAEPTSLTQPFPSRLGSSLE